MKEQISQHQSSAKSGLTQANQSAKCRYLVVHIHILQLEAQCERWNSSGLQNILTTAGNLDRTGTFGSTDKWKKLRQNASIHAQSVVCHRQLNLIRHTAIDTA